MNTSYTQIKEEDELSKLMQKRDDLERSMLSKEASMKEKSQSQQEEEPSQQSDKVVVWTLRNIKDQYGKFPFKVSIRNNINVIMEKNIL